MAEIYSSTSRDVIFRSAIFCFSIFWLSSCHAGNPTPDISGTVSLPAFLTFPSLTPTPLATPNTVFYERPLYRIRAALEIPATNAGDKMPVLTVHEEAFFSNTFAESIQELVLQFVPSVEADLFSLQGITCDRSSPDNPPAIRDGQLRVAFKDPLQPGESVSLSLDFRRRLAKENGLIGWDDNQIILGDWYAFFPLYQAGNGWLAYPPGKVGENLTYPYADFEIQLDITGGSAYQLAASGIPESDSSPWNFQFAGRSFAVALTKENLYPKMSGAVEVLAYAKSGNTAQGASMADVAAKSIDLYSKLFGEYPHTRFTVVESGLPDGMEFDGLVFLSPGLSPDYTGDGRDYLTAITAHETAHQWWYGRVANDQAMAPWLDESFAAYSELLFYEKYFPSLTDWWWWIRVNRYPSDQCIDQSIYDFNAFRPYINTVYLRGVTMLNALRLQMGGVAFLDSLREIQTAGFERFTTPDDVFRIFQSHSSQSLSGIWDQYFYRPQSQ